MDQHIERILNQIPGWNVADSVVTTLVGGITNQNYRIDIGGETFVLRIGGKGTHLLGIDRGVKVSALQLLHKLVSVRRSYTSWLPKTCLSHASSSAEALHLKLPHNVTYCAASSILYNVIMLDRPFQAPFLHSKRYAAIIHWRSNMAFRFPIHCPRFLH